MFGTGEGQDVDDESAFQGGQDLVGSAIDGGIFLAPPALLSRPGQDPLVSAAVEVDARHGAKDTTGPRGVEAGQDDAHVLLHQFSQRLSQVVDESLRLGQLDPGAVQQRHQPIVRLY